MNNYNKLKERHPLRRDIILIIVLLVLILVAIIFPRFTNLREPVEETEIIYIEDKSIINRPDPQGPDIAGYFLHERDEKPIPPEIIEAALDFEWPVLDTFELKPIGADYFENPPYYKPSKQTPEETWDQYYDIYVKRDPKLPEPGFGPLSGWMKRGMTTAHYFDTPASLIGGDSALFSYLDYPVHCLYTGIEGDVVLVININVDGTLNMVRVLQSSKFYDFDKAACDAMSKTKWSPASQKGIPVQSKTSYRVEFRLTNQVLIESARNKRKTESIKIPDINPEPPTPVGGIIAIYDNLVYPKEYINSGIEGTTIIQMYVEPDSCVRKAIVMKSCGFNALDSAALKAVKKTKYNPSSKRGVPIGVWIAIPVTFKLD